MITSNEKKTNEESAIVINFNREKFRKEADRIAYLMLYPELTEQEQLKEN